MNKKKLKQNGTNVKGKQQPHTQSSKSQGLTVNLPQWLWSSITALIFIVFAIIMLIGKNSDMLFTAQDRSIFLSTSEFFAERMALPGGLLNWVGCYLTQYFINPWWGGMMLITIWTITLLVSIHVFNLSRHYTLLALLPVCILLASVIDLGYWIYYLKFPGYWFNTSIGVLIVLLILWLIKWDRNSSTQLSIRVSIVCDILRVIGVVLFGVIGYVTMGWIGLLGLILIAVYKDSAFSARISAIISTAIIPWITYHFYSQYRIEDAWCVGFPLMQSDKLNAVYTTIPFILLICVLIALALLKDRLPAIRNKVIALITSGIFVVVTLTLVYSANINDYNYHAELRMHRAAMEQRWDDVLEESAANPGEPTREIVLLKNLALSEKNEFGDKFCQYGNGGILPYLRDSIRVRLVHTCGPLLYMYYGKENFATRWCIENEVEFGLSVNKAKILSYAALISREPKLAAKYLSILKQTTFHKGWAERYEPILKDTALVGDAKRYPEFAYSKELYDNFRTTLDADEGLVEIYLINYFSRTQNIDSKAMATATLNFACIGKDIQSFWPRFLIYAQLMQMKDGNDMPIHYQEAAYLYSQLEPQSVPVANMPFNEQRVVQRYQAFTQMSQSLLRQGMNAQQVGEAMKSVYGDTFWWFYFFCRDVKSY